MIFGKIGKTKKELRLAIVAQTFPLFSIIYEPAGEIEMLLH